MSGSATTNRHVVDDESFYDANTSETLSPFPSEALVSPTTDDSTQGGGVNPKQQQQLDAEEAETPPTHVGGNDVPHFSPQAPPPAAAPPPPPPGSLSSTPNNNSNNKHEEIATTQHPHQFAAQERFHPETSLPPTGVSHLSYNDFSLPQHHHSNSQPPQHSSQQYPPHIYTPSSSHLQQQSTTPQQLYYPHQQQHQQLRSQSSPSIPLNKVRQADNDHPLADLLAQPSLEDEIVFSSGTSAEAATGQSSQINIPEDVQPVRQQPQWMTSSNQQPPQPQHSELFPASLTEHVMDPSQAQQPQAQPMHQHHQPNYPQQFNTATGEMQQQQQPLRRPASDESVSSQLQNVDLHSQEGSMSHVSHSSSSDARRQQQQQMSLPQSYQHEGDASTTTPANNGVVRVVPVPEPPQSSQNRRQQQQQQPPAEDALSQSNNSYQHTSFVVHYEDEAEARARQQQQNNKNFRASGGGDATLSPNTGQTNSYDYALWGMAPHELLKFLQHINAAAGVSSLVIASLSWFGKLIFLQLPQVVLLAYLAAFSAVLVVVEVMAIVTPEQQRLIPTNVLGRIRDQLGFLFHPWGKAFFILLLTTMCWGIGGLFLSIIGSVYLISAIGWFYAACAYRSDLPRLMGSIDETFRAEARRRNLHAPRFSVSTWGALMEGGTAFAAAQQTAQQTWTRLVHNRDEQDDNNGNDTQETAEEGKNNEPGSDERTSLLSHS